MKKIILTSILSAACLLPMAAQVDNANRLILHSKTGETIVYNLTEMDYIDFDRVDDASVTASVKEGTLAQEGFTLVTTPGTQCGAYDVTYAAGSQQPVEKGTYTSTAEIEFAGLTPSTTYTVTISPRDIYGIACEPVTVTVTTLDPAPVQQPPKVGDYYYSDGTWSDGGLISIDSNGCNAVWQEQRPAPIAGKTVIGIVFSTDPSRIAPSDYEAGYTHGYAIGCKNITDPNKINYAQWPETVWYGAMNSTIEVIQVTKIGKSWYNNLIGREETQALLAEYADNPAHDIPMFYYGTTGYPVQAPESSSGWFIPSTGQMWDCIANFCSGDVAQKLFEARTLAYDFTYYFSEKVNVNVMEQLMKPFELVPDTDKDAMLINDGGNGSAGSPYYISIATSGRYDTESRCIFNLGNDQNGLLEGMAEWFDGETHARPILAF